MGNWFDFERATPENHRLLNISYKTLLWKDGPVFTYVLVGCDVRSDLPDEYFLEVELANENELSDEEMKIFRKWKFVKIVFLQNKETIDLFVYFDESLYQAWGTYEKYNKKKKDKFIIERTALMDPALCFTQENLNCCMEKNSEKEIFDLLDLDVDHYVGISFHVYHVDINNDEKEEYVLCYQDSNCFKIRAVYREVDGKLINIFEDVKLSMINILRDLQKGFCESEKDITEYVRGRIILTKKDGKIFFTIAEINPFWGQMKLRDKEYLYYTFLWDKEGIRLVQSFIEAETDGEKKLYAYQIKELN